jgi:hypothetical protein
MIFGLRLTTKRELLLWASMIEERDKRIAALETSLAELLAWSRSAVKHEQDRAEAAINILLTKTQNMAIKRAPEPVDLTEFERVQSAMMSMFGSDVVSKEDDARAAREIEAIQAKP